MLLARVDAVADAVSVRVVSGVAGAAVFLSADAVTVRVARVVALARVHTVAYAKWVMAPVASLLAGMVAGACASPYAREDSDEDPRGRPGSRGRRLRG